MVDGAPSQAAEQRASGSTVDSAAAVTDADTTTATPGILNVVRTHLMNVAAFISGTALVVLNDPPADMHPNERPLGTTAHKCRGTNKSRTTSPNGNAGRARFTKNHNTATTVAASATDADSVATTATHTIAAGAAANDDPTTPHTDANTAAHTTEARVINTDAIAAPTTITNATSAVQTIPNPVVHPNATAAATATTAATAAETNAASTAATAIKADTASTTATDAAPTAATATVFTPDQALDLVSKILGTLRKMHSASLRTGATRVDYDTILASPHFAQYRKYIALLPSVDPRHLPPNHYLCFFLNIYNALLLHAIAIGPPPRSLAHRLKMYATAAYRIGPFDPLSLNDIEHGVLRANSPPPVPFASKPFADRDPRLALAMPTVDPRIHFALNCGAISCPPIALYIPENVDKQLQIATESYIQQEVQVDQHHHPQVRLSMIFRWYEVDFGAEKGLLGALGWIQPYLKPEQAAQLESIIHLSRQNGADISIVFRDYDWGMNDFKQ